MLVYILQLFISIVEPYFMLLLSGFIHCRFSVVCTKLVEEPFNTLMHMVFKASVQDVFLFLSNTLMFIYQ